MRLWATGLAALLLTGCVRFEPRPISAADNAARLDARRLDDAGLRSFLEDTSGRKGLDWPPKTWDQETLTVAAFYFQPSLDTVRAQWREAQAGIKTAKARPNPVLTVTPGYDTSVPADITPWFPFGGLDVPLETAGKRSKRTAQAKQLSESARMSLVTAAWQVRSRVRASLLDFIVAERRVEWLQRQLAAQEQAVKLLEQRAEAGEISRSELTTAHLAANRARLDLGDARLKHTEARAQLAQAVGIPVAALDGLELNFDFSQRADEGFMSTDTRRAALQGRSDILAALADYSASEESLRLEIAKQYPDIHLNPGYQYDLGEDKWSLGLTVELPILNQNHGPIEEAKARREAAAARFSELQASVINEVDRAVAGYTVAIGQLKTSDELLAAGQQQLAAIEAQVRAGAADQLDLQNAQVESASVALAQMDGETKLQQALGSLEDALQRPLTGRVISAEKPPGRSASRTKSSTDKEPNK